MGHPPTRPHFNDVPDEMDRFLSVVHENWTIIDDPLVVPAYALWRMNWIHPFVEGNGRTARAACYYLICMRQGRLLPGNKIVPERIRENREPYYAALKAADRAWDEGHLDLSEPSGVAIRLLVRSLLKPSKRAYGDGLTRPRIRRDEENGSFEDFF